MGTKCIEPLMSNGDAIVAFFSSHDASRLRHIQTGGFCVGIKCLVIRSDVGAGKILRANGTSPRKIRVEVDSGFTVRHRDGGSTGSLLRRTRRDVPAKLGFWKCTGYVQAGIGREMQCIGKGVGPKLVRWYPMWTGLRGSELVVR
jgi:hypothetical protein